MNSFSAIFGDTDMSAAAAGEQDGFVFDVRGGKCAGIIIIYDTVLPPRVVARRTALCPDNGQLLRGQRRKRAA